MNLQDSVTSKHKSYYLTAEMRRRLTQKVRDENIRVAENRTVSVEDVGIGNKPDSRAVKRYFERRKNVKEKTG